PHDCAMASDYPAAVSLRLADAHPKMECRLRAVRVRASIGSRGRGDLSALATFRRCAWRRPNPGKGVGHLCRARAKDCFAERFGPKPQRQERSVRGSEPTD